MKCIHLHISVEALLKVAGRGVLGMLPPSKIIWEGEAPPPDYPLPTPLMSVPV